MVTLGLLFYMTPVMQLTWGVLVGHEPMPPARWVGFGLIWMALAVFTTDAVRRARVDRRVAKPPAEDLCARTD
jgi:chloramphenicol-sensitive protein RarD